MVEGDHTTSTTAVTQDGGQWEEVLFFRIEKALSIIHVRVYQPQLLFTHFFSGLSD